MATALLPLKRYADFRGRSTRTELILFSILAIFANMILVWIGFLIDAAAVPWVEPLFVLLLLCPALALAARRLHDSGRGGGWVVLGVPVLVWEAWRVAQLVQRRPPPFPDPLPGPVDIAASLCSLALLVLLLWNDDPQPNRYGPNPRYDEPGPTR